MFMTTTVCEGHALLCLCPSHGPSSATMATPSRSATLGLYRSLLRAAKGFSNYNFREYALRRVREDMREASALTDSTAVTRAHQEGRRQLGLIQRQATISAMFPQEKHAMEQ